MAFFRDLGLAVASLAPPPEAEPLPLPGEAPETYAMRAARAKALGAASLLDAKDGAGPSSSGASSGASSGSFPSNGYVLAADTAVVLDERILGKPRDEKDAFSMLRALAGREHRVITGCAIMPVADALIALCSGAAPRAARPPAAAREALFAVSSTVRMWDCPTDLLEAYALSGEPLDKAGAYAVQGAGAFLVERIAGSWSNVVGLPLAEVVQTLLALGIASSD